MLGKFPFVLQSYYPHMKPADVHIWEKYVGANPELYISCDYDVPVGPTPDWLDDELDAVTAKQAILYRKKIDVVAYSSDFVALIEVKPFAGSSALGQILGYDILYRRDFPSAPRTVPTVITNQCATGYAEIFRKLGVALIEVGVCAHCLHYPKVRPE